eukprot:TRINITY_DN8658_c0_g1_i2.p1 TRINITY_DN8658_c0_g1~~TRINITY_DN8658_c0_g1_i2.p1  ORF type:complete len:704 (-),score=169.20 TRINITY_DN8658_c0_g1_i2:183-2294(-)
MFQVAPIEEVTKSLKKELTSFANSNDFKAVIHKELQSMRQQLVKDVMKEVRKTGGVVPVAAATTPPAEAASAPGGGAIESEDALKEKKSRNLLRRNFASRKVAKPNRRGLSGTSPQVMQEIEAVKAAAAASGHKSGDLSAYSSTPHGGEDVLALGPGLTPQAPGTLAEVPEEADGRELRMESAEAATAESQLTEKEREVSITTVLQGRAEPALQEQTTELSTPLISGSTADETLALLDTTVAVEETTCHSRVQNFVHSATFENICAAALCMNGALLGYETQLLATGYSAGLFAEASELLFCIFFTLELTLRIYAVGCKGFFTGSYGEWGYFDCGMVSVQILDQLMNFCTAGGKIGSVKVIQMLRILRIIRITRTFRMLHLSDTLLAVFSSMASSLQPAAWAFVLFLVLLYVCSVLILQVTFSYNATGIAESPELADAFPDLLHTMLTLFECLVGGMEWSRILNPLMEEISPYMGFWFCSYVLCGIFVILNLVVSVFTEKVTKAVREDKDQDAAQGIAALFGADGGTGEDSEITWEVFAGKLEENAMVDYFKSIDVYPSVGEARGLFELIDVDGSGGISAAEIVNGCLRLKGPARALEVALILRDTSRISDILSEVRSVSSAVASANAQLAGIARQQQQPATEAAENAADAQMVAELAAATAPQEASPRPESKQGSKETTATGSAPAPEKRKGPQSPTPSKTSH